MELTKINREAIFLFESESVLNDCGENIDHSSRRVYSKKFQGKDLASIPLNKVLSNNPLMQIILLIRFASPKDEGFSYPIFSPVQISNLLNNPILQLLNDTFSYVNISADTKKKLVYDITCGPLKPEIQKELSLLLNSDFFNPDLKSFFPEYKFSNLSVEDRYQEIFEIHSVPQKQEHNLDSSSHPLLYYIAWTLSCFKIPICEIPYYGRTITQIQNDSLLQKIINISKTCYISGNTDKGEWLSCNLIIKQLSPKALENFERRLWI